MIRVLLATGVLALFAYQQSGGRPRARDLGIAPGSLTPGPLNAITDVDGVRVGHTTIKDGDNVRTGVTAIVPHGGNLFQEKVAGAVLPDEAVKIIRHLKGFEPKVAAQLERETGLLAGGTLG